MLISHKHKWIFIHIPKNAGSTATWALSQYADIEGTGVNQLLNGATPKNDRIDLSFFQHDTASVIKEKLKEQEFNYDDYFKFGIVRNPWSRVVSKWAYWHKLVAEGSAFAHAHYVCDKFKTFREYIKSGNPGELSQTDYLFDSNNIQLQSLKTMSPRVKKSKDWVTSGQGLEHRITPQDLIVDRVIHMENYVSELSSVFDYIKNECGQEIWERSYEKIIQKENKTKHKHYTKYYDDETHQLVAKKYAKDIEYFGYKFGE